MVNLWRISLIKVIKSSHTAAVSHVPWQRGHVAGLGWRNRRFRSGKRRLPFYVESDPREDKHDDQRDKNCKHNRTPPMPAALPWHRGQ